MAHEGQIGDISISNLNLILIIPLQPINVLPPYMNFRWTPFTFESPCIFGLFSLVSKQNRGFGFFKKTQGFRVFFETQKNVSFGFGSSWAKPGFFFGKRSIYLGKFHQNRTCGRKGMWFSVQRGIKVRPFLVEEICGETHKHETCFRTYGSRKSSTRSFIATPKFLLHNLHKIDFILKMYLLKISHTRSPFFAFWDDWAKPKLRFVDAVWSSNQRCNGTILVHRTYLLKLNWTT